MSTVAVLTDARILLGAWARIARKKFAASVIVGVIAFEKLENGSERTKADEKIERHQIADG
jgi:hypothetical protein